MNYPVYVAIPVYNGARTIKRTLENIFKQTYTDFTILVYDDGSTDWTRQILHKARDFDSRVRILEGVQNEGRGAARNHLLAAAADGLIAWQDADDLWSPSKLQEQIAFFDGLPDRGIDPQKSVIISTFDRASKREGREVVTRNVPPDPFDIKYILGEDYGQCPFQLQATFGLTSVYINSGGFDPALNWAEDVDIALNILGSGNQIVPHQARIGLARYHHALGRVDGDVVVQAQARIIQKHRGLAECYGLDIESIYSRRRLGYLFNIYLENRNFQKAIYTALAEVINADEEKLMVVSRNLAAVFRAMQQGAGARDSAD